MPYVISHELQDGSGVRRLWKDPDNLPTVMTLDTEWDAWAAASKYGLSKPMVMPIGGSGKK
jgi:hypothetical protein